MFFSVSFHETKMKNLEKSKNNERLYMKLI